MDTHTDFVDTWDMRKTIGAVGVAGAIAGLGGAAITAAADGGNHFGGGGMHGGGGPGGPPPAASAPHVVDDAPESLHGEYVVADDGGQFTTQVSQTGSVTAISSTSVTARSADGFTQTYVIREANGAAPPPFSVGDVLTISATREGEGITVNTMRPSLAPGH